MDDKEIGVDYGHERGVGLSRRAFLKGSGALAGAAVLAGSGLGLTGCTSNADAKTGNATGNGSYSVIDVELLIIGGGLGALSAAYQAVEKGQNVTIVDKGPFGFSGAAGFNWDLMHEWVPASDFKLEPIIPNVTNEVALKAAMLTDPNADGLVTLMNRGQVAGRRNPDGSVRYVLKVPGFEIIEGSYPRHEQDQLKRSPFLSIEDRTMLTDLLVNDGVCLGAIGIHLPSGELRVYRANAVILAAGGSCWMNGWSTVSARTINSPDNTSDIEIAAYRHGAAIGDAEYGAYDLITTYPTGIAYGFNSGIGADANENAYILGGDGKPLLTDPSYDKVRFQFDRVYFNQILGTELAKGRGTKSGGCLIDLSKPEIRAGLRQTYARSIALFKDNFGIDVSTDLIELGLEMYEHGGAPVISDKLMSTEIAGLFCVRGTGVYGENAGTSVYLSNRFGSYATRCAIEYLGSLKAPKTIDWTPVADEYTRLHELRTREVKGGLRPHVVRHKIQQACGTCMSIVREKAALEAAVTELARIRTEDMPKMVLGTDTLTYNMDWKQAIENYNLLEIAEMSVKATLMREETRGQYVRVDFPKKDDAKWKCVIAASLKDHAMTFAKREMPELTW
ncbi:MAG: FAD-binding protein [Coriobacteriia bacterium]|nr:FAD-binding protein [Coriobacteriia bacterium]